MSWKDFLCGVTPDIKIRVRSSWHWTPSWLSPSFHSPACLNAMHFICVVVVLVLWVTRPELVYVDLLCFRFSPIWMFFIQSKLNLFVLLDTYLTPELLFIVCLTGNQVARFTSPTCHLTCPRQSDNQYCWALHKWSSDGQNNSIYFGNLMRYFLISIMTLLILEDLI